MVVINSSSDGRRSFTEPQWSDAWLRYEMCLKHPVPGGYVYAYGRPGTGKTHKAFHAETAAGRPVMVGLTEQTSAAEIRGHYVARGGDFHVQVGPVVEAMRRGATLLINDLHEASGDAMGFLLAALEDPVMVRVRMPDGRVVTPLPGFRVVATSNAHPMSLPAPLLSRLPIVIAIGAPNPRIYESYDPVVATLVRQWNQRRQGEERAGGDEPYSLLDTADPRRWGVFDRMARAYGLEVACLCVFGAEGRHLLNSHKVTGD